MREESSWWETGADGTGLADGQRSTENIQQAIQSYTMSPASFSQKASSAFATLSPTREFLIT